MTDFERPLDEAPTIEVRVFRNGVQVAVELCESEVEARDALDQWSEIPGTTFAVDDLSVRHRPGDISEPDPAVVFDDADERVELRDEPAEP